MILVTEHQKEGCIHCGARQLVIQTTAKPGQENYENQERLKCLCCKRTQMKMKTFK